jgi:hypothetical protein
MAVILIRGTRASVDIVVKSKGFPVTRHVGTETGQRHSSARP